jgi:drug/metabolite transporter (DMT)-like permease
MISKKFSKEISGIFYMILCMIFFSLNDTTIKYILSKSENKAILAEVIFLRGVFSTIILGIYLYLNDKLNFKILKSPALHLRGLFESIAGLFFFIGLIFLPLGDLYALLNLAPILITAAGAFFLKEKVGWRRWTAVLFGFLGVIIIIHPQHLQFGYAFIFPLVSAIFIAKRDTITRKMLNKFDSLHVIFITSIFITVFFGFGMFFYYQPINFYTLQFIFLSSILILFGYFFSVKAIKATNISITSPFRYTILIWGIIFGYYIFKEIPSYNMIFGSCIIAASGIFIIIREKKIGIIK